MLAESLAVALPLQAQALRSSMQEAAQEARQAGGLMALEPTAEAPFGDLGTFDRCTPEHRLDGR